MRNTLENHLSTLRNVGKISTWHDLELEAGTEWEPAILNKLDTADIILLLVSSNFIASKYCYGTELKRAIARHHEGTARVIPIILRSCDWNHADVPFSKLNVLPTHAKAITGWPDQEEAFTIVARQIRETVDQLRAKRLAQVQEEQERIQRGQQLKAEEEARQRLAQQETEQQLEQKRLLREQRQAEEQEKLLKAEKLRQQQAAEAARRKQEELEPPPNVPPVTPSPLSLPTALFEFEVATITKGSFLKKPEGNRTRKRAKSYTADLGNNIFLEMVAIPGGSFNMGSTESGDEQPVHKVTVAPFFLGRYPITQAQWRVVAGFDKVKCDLQPDPSRFKGVDRPIERVSWREAVEFCDRLSRKTNHTYRLPSEAEWEYACRAGTTTPFHFGETITPNLANYDGNYTYGSGSKGEYREQTTPVGSFGVANAFGLYDMHGNVWEWCADHWHSDYKGAPTDGSAWLTADQNAQRLLRGGSWYDAPRSCRSADRDHYTPDSQGYDIGFRVVCVSSWTA